MCTVSSFGIQTLYYFPWNTKRDIRQNAQAFCFPYKMDGYLYQRSPKKYIRVYSKRQPRAPSRETNTEVTKTAINRLAARGWLQKWVNPIDSPC